MPVLLQTERHCCPAQRSRFIEFFL